MKKIFLLVTFLVVVSLGDTTTVSIDTTVIDTTAISLEKREGDAVPAHKKKRYRVVSAVMMMLFVGIAMGTSQSNNPK